MSAAHSLLTIDLNLLRVFDEIYSHRNLTQAAERLGVTQSALSHNLRRLREVFHDELFVRQGMAMEPTSRAIALQGPVRRIMETVSSEVLAMSQFEPAAANREFLLAMVDMGEVVFLPPLMQHLKKHAPGCTIRTRRMPNESVADSLDAGNVELAIGNINAVKDSIYRQTLFEHDYVVLASKHHPRIRSKLSWKAYQAEEHVVVASGSDDHLRLNILEPKGIRRKALVSVGGFLSVPWLIKGTELLATVPTRLSEDIAKAADLKQFALPERTAPLLPVFAVAHPPAQRSRTPLASRIDLQFDAYIPCYFACIAARHSRARPRNSLVEDLPYRLQFSIEI